MASGDRSDPIPPEQQQGCKGIVWTLSCTLTRLGMRDHQFGYMIRF
jgi:hypothetical protein